MPTADDAVSMVGVKVVQTVAGAALLLIGVISMRSRALPKATGVARPAAMIRHSCAAVLCSCCRLVPHSQHLTFVPRWCLVATDMSRRCAGLILVLASFVALVGAEYALSAYMPWWAIALMVMLEVALFMGIVAGLAGHRKRLSEGRERKHKQNWTSGARERCMDGYASADSMEDSEFFPCDREQSIVDAPSSIHGGRLRREVVATLDDTYSDIDYCDERAPLANLHASRSSCKSSIPTGMEDKLRELVKERLQVCIVDMRPFTCRALRSMHAHARGLLLRSVDINQ